MNAAAALVRKPDREAADAAGRSEKTNGIPPFLEAMGVRPGEWQFITKPQLESLNQPHYPEHVRVWAVGMLHSIGYRGECAVKQIPIAKVRPYMQVIERGRWKALQGATVGEEYALVPLAPVDIGAKTNPPMQKSTVSRAIDQLEALGQAQQIGKIKGHIRIVFFARPRCVDPNLVSKPVNQNGKRLNEDARRIVAFSQRLRKCFFPRLSNEALPLDPILVSNPEYQKAVESELLDIYKVIEAETKTRLNRLSQAFRANQMVNEKSAPLKEETYFQTAAATVAAAAVRTDRHTNTDNPSNRWPLTLDVVASAFPTVGPAFVEKIVIATRALVPNFTDEELARACIKKPRQQSEGLFLQTVPEVLLQQRRLAARRPPERVQGYDRNQRRKEKGLEPVPSGGTS